MQFTWQLTELRFNFPLDTNRSQTLFPANLLPSTDKTKPDTTKPTIHHQHKETLQHTQNKHTQNWSQVCSPCTAFSLNTEKVRFLIAPAAYKGLSSLVTSTINIVKLISSWVDYAYCWWANLSCDWNTMPPGAYAIWCLSQARINWESCDRKSIRREIGGMMEVGASMVQIRWRPAGLWAHLPLFSPCLLKSRMMTDSHDSFQVWVSECLFWYQPTRVVPDKGLKWLCVCVCGESTEKYKDSMKKIIILSEFWDTGYSVLK